MSNIFYKILLFFIYFLFFSIPLINSKIFISDVFLVNGNFEFTKVIFFDVISSLIIILFFFINILSKKILIEVNNSSFLKFILIFWIIMFISTTFSTSFYQSLFGSQEKLHGFLMWNNLIGLSIIFYNILDKKIFKKVNKLLIFSSFILALYGIEQCFFLNNLGVGNRLISTMGHPNYLSPIFLFVLVFTGEKLKNKKNIAIYIIIFLAFIFTKSFIAIFLYFSYLLFIKVLPNINYYNKSKTKVSIIYIIFVILSLFIISIYFPSKISSFISRFYIFENVFRIIFSDIKIFFLGIGLDNLLYYFDSFKNPNLYIFENIGFTADRSHNLLLDFFVFTGFFGFLSILYLYIYIFKSLKNNNPYNYGLFLCSIFLLFNPGSIVIYLIMIFYLVYDIKKNEKVNEKLGKNCYLIYKSLLVIIFIFSVINIYFSTKYYIAETYSYKKDYKKAIEIFSYNPNYYYNIGQYEKGLKIDKVKSENYYISKINYGYDLEKNCEELIKKYETVENYFYCGDLLEKDGQEKKSKEFYKKGLEKLPDLWNKDSKYYDDIIIKKFINGNRFFSEKYSNLKKILKSFENN